MFVLFGADKTTPGVIDEISVSGFAGNKVGSIVVAKAAAEKPTRQETARNPAPKRRRCENDFLEVIMDYDFVARKTR